MRFIPVIAAAAVLSTAVACTPADGTDPNIATPPPASHSVSKGAKHSKPKLPDGMHEVTYRIGGTASKAMVTYSTPSGQEQQSGAHVPWHRSMKAKDFTVLALTAQNSGAGTITCEIDVDGKKVKASKSSGAYAVVSCDAPLGF